MKWEKAKISLEQDKKLRRPMWQEGSYIFGTDPVMWSGGDKACFCTAWFDASDWEIYEERKTLSDKVFDIKDEKKFIGEMYRFSDVKESLKEFIDWVHEIVVTDSKKHVFVDIKAKELFGARLW